LLKKIFNKQLELFVEKKKLESDVDEGKKIIKEKEYFINILKFEIGPSMKFKNVYANNRYYK